MTYTEITQNIYKDNKKIYKKGKMRIGILLFCSCLSMFIRSFAAPVIQYAYDALLPFTEDLMAETTYELLFNMVYYVISIVVPYLLVMIVSRTGFKKAFPLKARMPRNPVGFILFAFGICLIFNYVLSILTPWYSELFPSDETLYESGIDIALYFVQVAILPAIFEELVFRGITFGALKPLGTRFAVILSAILFGMAHIYPLQSMFATLFGLLLGGVYVATGSLWTCVLLHFFNNAFAVLASYSAEMIEKGNMLVPMFVSAVVYAAMAYSIVYLIKYIKLPGRFPMAIKEEKESMLTGSGFSPLRAVLTNFWTYVFVILYVLIVVLLIIGNLYTGAGSAGV